MITSVPGRVFQLVYNIPFSSPQPDPIQKCNASPCLYFFLEIFEMVIPLPPQVIRVMLPALLLIRVYIKALRITWIPYGRDNRASIFPVIAILPIHSLEEWVVFDTLCAARDISQTFRAVHCAELPNDVFSWVGDCWFGWKMNWFGDNSGMVSKSRSVRGRASDCLYISMGFWFQKGGYPVRNSYIKIPNAHQSTAVVWPLDWMTSGARYSGVPQSVYLLPPFRIKR
jgi:hypothetical protein